MCVVFDWQKAVCAADDLLREGLGLEVVEKTLNPLDDNDFVKIVNGFAADLARVSGPIERHHIVASIKKMDVDWVEISDDARRKVLLAANVELRKATPRVLPKVNKRFPAHVKRISRGTRVETSRRFELKLDTTFDKVDQNILKRVASDQGLFVTNQYGTIHKTFTRQSKQIVENGLAEGLRSEEISKDLAVAARKYGTLRTGNYWRVLASAYANRSRTYAQLASYKDAQLTRYRFEAVLDERTTEQCRLLDGKTFAVKDSLAISRKLQVPKDPQMVKSITPWIRQRTIKSGANKGKTELFIVDKDGKNKRRVAVVEESAFGEVDERGRFSDTMSNAELMNNGIAQPPLHGLCRSVIVPIV